MATNYTDTSVNELIISKISQEQYLQLSSQGMLNENEIYLVENEILDAMGHAVVNVADPTELSDAANKHYVDSVSTVISSSLFSEISSVKDSLSIFLSSLMMETTWAELTAMRSNSELIPGMSYRITDYSTVINGKYNLTQLVGQTTYLHYASSAGHDFDLIVTADTGNSLNENARAVMHDGDTYFENSNLAAWKIKYTINNEPSIYGWADGTNGKGVIYYLEDEFGNSAGYDFKNIRFLRYALRLADETSDYTPVDSGLAYDSESQPNRYGSPYHVFLVLQNYIQSGSYVNPFSHSYKGMTVADYDFAGTIGTAILGYAEVNSQYLETFEADWYYTFDFFDSGENVHDDASLGLNSEVKVQHNHIDLEVEPFLYFTQNNSDTYGLGGNVFELNDINIDEDKYCMYNVLKHFCPYNTFGNDCNSNTFENGCFSNTFGDNCDSNTFGYSCHSNTFGDICSSNTFGYDCDSNTFGNGCKYNTFGDDCDSNTFGNGCDSNTFGNSCHSNAFGNDCDSNTFGDDCDYNTFGGDCNHNTFGGDCDSNTFGDDCNHNTFGNSCGYNDFGYGCYSNTFGYGCNHILFGLNSFSSKSYCRYITVENGNQYIKLNPTGTTSSSQYYQNVLIAMGVNNTTTYKTITDSNVGQTFKTTYQPANSIVVSV